MHVHRRNVQGLHQWGGPQHAGHLSACSGGHAGQPRCHRLHPGGRFLLEMLSIRVVLLALKADSSDRWLVHGRSRQWRAPFVTVQVQRLHWHWADPVASVAIAALIVAAVWPLVQQSASQLLESPPAMPPAQVLSALRFEETAAEPAKRSTAAHEAVPKAEPKAVKQQQQQPPAEPVAAPVPMRRQPAGHTGERIRRSPRKSAGQPAWLSDMVA